MHLACGLFPGRQPASPPSLNSRGRFGPNLRKHDSETCARRLLGVCIHIHIQSKRVFEFFFLRLQSVAGKDTNTAVKAKYATAVWSKCCGVFLSFAFCQLFLRQKVSTNFFGYENSNVIRPDVQNLVHAQHFIFDRNSIKVVYVIVSACTHKMCCMAIMYISYSLGPE